ncbi:MULTISPECIES: malonyl-ACP O-methyltransferase BioC [unclassified Acinetobacter]|uniref:malonyl-ACP O-methyltransferase BioC n=1 Tax=unclassified Acinetobacter TaxID=196816 RepID=UPI002A18E896|nr:MULTISPECIES: malonyl-ACP O-methyltransferase BioC [unclassified Acinetobacter]
MFVNLNKSLIAQRFAKAGQSYTEQAVIQKKICQHLCQLMQASCPKHLPDILEIGCGSGNLTQQVAANFQVEQWHLNDLYPQVQPHFQSDLPIQWMIGDIETLTLPQHLDAIVSSSAVQWMTDLSVLLARCHAALKRQGWLCFSTFGPDNFTEIKQLTGQGLQYWSIDDWRQQLEQLNFEIVELSQQYFYMQFETPKAVLKHIKATGVTGTSVQQQRWTKQSLTEFYHRYQQFQLENGLYTLTYHPVYCIARRKA